MAEMTKKDNVFQAVKFALFSASAGIIQVVSFTLLNEVIVPNINIDNETVRNILSAEYGVCYLVALTLSVLWNFTFNRKFPFKSATNIPVAMAKIFGFYCVFTPVTVILGELVAQRLKWEFAEYLILGVTMITNMVTEFLYCRFVVYKDSMNTNQSSKEKEKQNAAK
jgi:putative flippase GtrA